MKILSSSLLALGLMSASMSAAIVASWDFSNDADPNGGGAVSTPDSVLSGFTVSELSRGASFTPGTLTFNTGRGAFMTEANSGQTATYDVNSTFYATFTVTPSSNMALSSIDVAHWAQVDFGSDFSMNVVFGDVGNFAATSTTVGTVNPVSPNWSGAISSFDLTGFSALQNRTSAVEFRLYFFGNQGAWNQRGLGQISGANNDIQLNGAIPEPSTYAMIAGALALSLVAWRRRR